MTNNIDNKISLAGNPQMKIVYVPISELRHPDYNPRTRPDEGHKQLKVSYLRHGPLQPLLLNSAPNRKNIIMSGNFRADVMEELGYTEVPAVYVNVPDIEKEKEICLRLNRSAGDWDFEMLKDFKIDTLLDIGFDNSELSTIWDNIGVEDDNFSTEEELQKIKEPKTKPGQMFALGDSRLLCGSATNLSDVKRLVGDNRIDLILNDPPFNLSLSYEKGMGGQKNYGGTLTDDNLSDEDYRKFLKSSLQNALAVAKPDCHSFYYVDQNSIGLMQQLYKDCGLEPKRVVLWIKGPHNPTPLVGFNKSYEPAVYGVRGKPYLSPKVLNLNEIMNREVSSGNRALDDILDIIDLWLVRRLPGNEYSHPAEKPASVHERAIRRCTKPGDCILDSFAGSASTMACALPLHRKIFLIEHQPIFCDLILTRYERLTNDKPKLIS